MKIEHRIIEKKEYLPSVIIIILVSCMIIPLFSIPTMMLLLVNIEYHIPYSIMISTIIVNSMFIIYYCGKLSKDYKLNEPVITFDVEHVVKKDIKEKRK